ncbi:hypothetical protein LINGRAHAP2_LOCUS17422 [Linum grandiflorum]
MMMNINHHFTLLLLLHFIFFLTSPFLRHSSAATVLVDGVSPWKNPSLYVGDSVIFKHKYGYSLYIFQSFNAFDLCNFTQATLLTNPFNSPASGSYSWHTSRPGFFYFAFSNGSSSSSSCDRYSQKLAIKVSPAPPPKSSPTPVSGGGVSASPTYPWPFQPREKSVAAWAPSPEPSAAAGGRYEGASAPMKVPKVLPEKGGGVPFINSNPAVPLPNGEVDSATIRPLPTSADASGGCYNQMKRKGMIGVMSAILLTWLWL